MISNNYSSRRNIMRRILQIREFVITAVIPPLVQLQAHWSVEKREYLSNCIFFFFLFPEIYRTRSVPLLYLHVYYNIHVGTRGDECLIPSVYKIYLCMYVPLDVYCQRARISLSQRHDCRHESDRRGFRVTDDAEIFFKRKDITRRVARGRTSRRRSHRPQIHATRLRRSPRARSRTTGVLHYNNVCDISCAARKCAIVCYSLVLVA